MEVRSISNLLVDQWGLLPVRAVVHVTCSYGCHSKYQATGVSSGQEVPKTALLSLITDCAEGSALLCLQLKFNDMDQTQCHIYAPILPIVRLRLKKKKGTAVQSHIININYY